MRKENLNVFFKPKSVAIIGATERENSVGRALCVNLLKSSKTNRKTKVYFVNPNRERIFGKKCYKNISQIDGPVQLCVIAVRREKVRDVVRECAKKEGLRGVIIISAGFSEIGKSGRVLQEEIVSILKEKDILLLGPNCLGVVSPVNDFNVSFSPETPPRGGLAVISQSGALLDALIETLGYRGVGFSHLVSYGNGAMLGVEDFVEYFGQDKSTKAIMIYLEGLKNGREFIQSLKKVSPRKPVIVLKGGKTKRGEKAALSHTGSLATEKRLFSLAFKEGGAFEAQTFDEFLFLGELFSKGSLFYPKKPSEVAIVTNAGAVGVLLSDMLSERGISLQKNSPLDVRGDASANVFVEAVRFMIEQKKTAMAVVAITPQAMTDFKKIASGLKNLAKIYPSKMILPIFLSDKKLSQIKRKVFVEKNIVFLDSLQSALWTIEALIFYSSLVK